MSDTTKPAAEKKIDEIRRLCKEADISITELMRKADVPQSTVFNWDRKEPDAFTTYNKLIETFKVMKAEKETENTEPKNGAV